MTDDHFLDGFFNKPINESTDVFRNPRLYPYRYRNVDDQLERSKRSMLDTTYWDKSNSCNDWFSSSDRDYYLMAKTVLIVFACIACLVIFLLCVISCIQYCSNRCCETCKMSDRDDESDKLIKCP